MPRRSEVYVAGTKVGPLTVLDTSKSGGKVFYRCKCSGCGTVSNLRADTFKRLMKTGLDVCHCKSKINGQAYLKALLTRYKSRAKRDERQFLLTETEFFDLITQECHYCGLEPQVSEYDSLMVIGKFKHNGVDRLDSNLGYTPDNCITACKRCNYAKHTMSYGGFMLWVDSTYNHLHSIHAHGVN